MEAGYDVPPRSNANYAWILNMVSKLSENGVAGFIFSQTVHYRVAAKEYELKEINKNNLVEAILILPREYVLHY